MQIQHRVKIINWELVGLSSAGSKFPTYNFGIRKHFGSYVELVLQRSSSTNNKLHSSENPA